MDFDSLKRHPEVIRIYNSRVKLERQGKELVGICPLPGHSEKTPSFKVNDKDGVLLWKCFGCGQGGSIIDLISKMDGVSASKAAEAIEKIVEGSWESQKKIVEASFKPVATAEALTIPLSKYAQLEHALGKNPQAVSWLKDVRGITYDTARKLHLGFRQSVDFAPKNPNANGGWIAFPCIQNGEVVSIKYRSIKTKDFLRQPKMRTALFNAETIDPLEPVYVVEGECDACVLEQIGLHAVSLPNATDRLSPEMKDQLMQADKIILAGDGDEAGFKAMKSLWASLKGSYLLKWPTGCKDANAFVLSQRSLTNGDLKAALDKFTATAESQPMDGVYSLTESMLASERTDMANHPERLRFPWKPVDSMVNLMPGGMMGFFATSTGMGKTTFVMNTLIEEAKRGQVILNYSAELTAEEYGNLVAAHVLHKDRNILTKEDYREAANRLKGIQFYIGRNPDLTTANQVLDLMELAIQRLSPSIIVIDHLHYIVRNEPDTIKAQENASQRIKNLAVKYNLKAIVVGQPRKADQKHQGKVANLNSAKGSESFSSDADAVIALHRDYLKNIDPNAPPKEPFSPLTQVHLLKGRSQGTGNAYAQLMFAGKIATFTETTLREEPDAQETLEGVL